MSDQESGNGDKVPSLKVDSSLKIVQCPCQNSTYTILVLPNVKDGAAQLMALVCKACEHMIELEGEAFMGSRKPKIYIDSKGRKHHRLKAETAEYGLIGRPLKH